jgi:hypothetical protein
LACSLLLAELWLQETKFPTEHLVSLRELRRISSASLRAPAGPSIEVLPDLVDPFAAPLHRLRLPMSSWPIQSLGRHAALP